MNKGKKLKVYLERSSPTILTCIASAGVIATAILAVRATPKAVELIRKDSMINHDGDPKAYTKAEAIKSAWHCYIPSAVVGTSTIICMFGANILNKRQQAALTSAYALMNNAYQDYKSKVKELYGEETHRAVMDSIAAEKAKDTHICTQCFGNTLDFGDDSEEKRLFYDTFSKRYFETTIEKVIEAEYHLNRNFALGGGEITLNEFYDFLGLEKVDYGDRLGWCINDEMCWIDFDHHKTILDDGLEVYIIDMVYEPTSDFLENSYW